MHSGTIGRWSGILLAIVLIATACGTGPAATSNSGSGPTSTTSESATDAATSFGAARLDQLLGGATAPPSSISWAAITSGATLSGPQTTAFCKALAVPGADNALSSILAAGLNALSMRLRKRPLSTDTKEVLGLAVTFATNTCPAWNPGTIRFATLAPIEPWYPNGYQPMILQPDVAWRWAEAGTLSCEVGPRCYGLNVATRDDCSGHIEGTIATYDSNGVVLEYVTDRKLDPQLLHALLVFDWSDPSTVDAGVMSISCV